MGPIMDCHPEPGAPPVLSGHAPDSPLSFLTFPGLWWGVGRPGQGATARRCSGEGPEGEAHVEDGPWVSTRRASAAGCRAAEICIHLHTFTRLLLCPCASPAPRTLSFHARPAQPLLLRQNQHLAGRPQGPSAAAEPWAGLWPREAAPTALSLLRIHRPS